MKAIELDAADYAQAVAAGLWKWLEDPFLWDAPSFDSGLPMPLSIDTQPPPAPSASLERTRDRLIRVEQGRGIALIDGDSPRTLLRVLRRLSPREVAVIAWSIGLDPPPSATRLAAAGPAPDGVRWLEAAASEQVVPRIESSRTRVPRRVRVVSGRVPTWLVVFSAALAGAAVVAATAARIASGEPAAPVSSSVEDAP